MKSQQSLPDRKIGLLKEEAAAMSKRAKNRSERKIGGEGQLWPRLPGLVRDALYDRLSKSFVKSRFPATFTWLKAVRQRARHVTRGTVTKLKCKSLTGVSVNVGCGGSPRRGWINLDILPYREVMCWDCAKGLPFNDGTVDAIYSEHFFEHLDYHSEARQFLRACLRCLRSKGTLRIVVPDAGKYLKFYAEEDWDKIAAMRPLAKDGNNYRDLWPTIIHRTRMEFVNFLFRQNGEHKYAYDAETLILMLREAGFSQSFESDFNASSDPNMTKDTDERRNESLYVEAIK
jgi:predicted SAM-dependent methyltransferase